MKHLLFILGLLFRRSKRVSDETDFLGFEAFTRPTGTNDGPTISSPDAEVNFSNFRDVVSIYAFLLSTLA